MLQIRNLFLYLRDRIKYGDTTDVLFWFKKNKGKNWIKGQNFGDYLSVIIVGELLRKRKLTFDRKSNSKQKLLAVGSVLHFANSGDTIWGSGINGKIAEDRHRFTSLDVRAVRGPLTRNFLLKKGIEVGEVYGDPVLLLPQLFPKLKGRPVKNKIILIPNLNELKDCKEKCPKGIKLVSPLGYWKDVVHEILTSELVLTSSLHGLLIAEIFEIKARFIKPFGGETLFKYEDYYLGTGRVLETPIDTFNNGISVSMGVLSSTPRFNHKDLIDSFPYYLFEKN